MSPRAFSPPQSMRSVVRGARRRLRAFTGRSGEIPWVVHEANPDDPRIIGDFRFFAVLGTWMEGDVVGATVRNALNQGCEEVFLVDNESPDDTVAEALAAGATLSRTYRTDSYDETLRISLMNDVVREQSEACGADHVWWLWVDGDEFPHGPGGLTLHDYLASLDRRFRIVGGRYFDHYPTGEPAYVPGRHPVDFQPLCDEISGRFCELGHRSHPLQRFDKHGPPITRTGGYHMAKSSERPLKEPTQGIYVHHVPFREEAVTRERLRLLCEAEEGRPSRNQANDDRLGGRASGITLRFRSLEAVYEGRWDEVQRKGKGGVPGVNPRPWTEWVPPEDVGFSRWYER
jgi:hypothetical protein